jgi:hypothetical protein
VGQLRIRVSIQRGHSVEAPVDRRSDFDHGSGFAVDSGHVFRKSRAVEEGSVSGASDSRDSDIIRSPFGRIFRKSQPLEKAGPSEVPESLDFVAGSFAGLAAACLA